MIILLSPSKTLDFETEKAALNGTELIFRKEAEYLMGKLKMLKPAKIAKMMDLSENLARLNFERYQQWRHPFGESQSRHCIYAFKGDVYLGLEAELFNANELAFAQQQWPLHNFPKTQFFVALSPAFTQISSICPHHIKFVVLPLQIPQCVCTA